MVCSCRCWNASCRCRGSHCSRPDIQPCQLRGYARSHTVFENGRRKHEPYFYNNWAWEDTIIIPESVQTIGKNAFQFIEARIVVPSSVHTIGDKAFWGCERLIGSDLNLENLTHLGNNAFERCVSLKSIQLPDTLASIGTNPFARCASLSIIEISAQHPYKKFFSTRSLWT